MESAHSLAMRELARIREENKNTQNARYQKVYQLIPDYARIELALAKQGNALARRVLEGKSDISDIETAIRKLQAEKATLLKSAGLAEDFLDDIYTCEHCRDTGFQVDGSRCDCLKQLIAAFAVRNANLTDFMKEQTFDKADFSLFADQGAENGRHPLAYIKQAHNAGLRFAETFDTTHGNLLLMGNAGTGKTFLSSCIANYALARQKTVYYQSAFQLFDTLEKLKFGRLDDEEQSRAELISRYLYEVDLLIIDDLGTEFVSAFSTALLFDIVNRRLIQEKSTILSTNISHEALEQMYSRRLLSRILGSYDVLTLIGQDLRLKKFNTSYKKDFN